MQSVRINGLEQLDEDLNSLLKEFPEARRKLHEEFADLLKTEVNTQIDSSGLRDERGKIKGWQESSVGSGGGYAVTRPEKSSTGANSPGAITNYLESGHQIRKPSGRAKRYRPRIKRSYVDGYHFYQKAQRSVEAKAIRLAEKFAEDLTKRIEGGSTS